MTTPQISISCPTTYSTSIEEDLRNYAAGGATGIGIWEYKLKDGEDSKVIEEMERLGLAATLNCGKVPSVIQDRFFMEPADPKERIAAMVENVRRWAPFKPAAILITTGDPEFWDPATIRQVTVDGLKQVAEAAGEAGLKLGIEPYRKTSGTMVSTITEAMELIAEVGAPNMGVLVDLWHSWDTPTVHDELATYAADIVGIQLSDYRDPTRGWCDRVLPGDGKIDLKAFFRTFEAIGYQGWYDVEIFSDNGLFGNDYPDSVWSRPPAAVAQAAVEQTLALWNARNG
ncbi:MAG: sugar phosphate isomerase/epimerase [Propionibacteriaceae bacterium]|jgi:sugar phosphate isomerase/epimerase|nr:sugar phosphate isomerase/epimerase [Propionibacteriaceae bacterium]